MRLWRSLRRPQRSQSCWRPWGFATRVQLPREKRVTGAPPGAPSGARRAAASMRRHWAALLRCAAAVARMVERKGSSGAGAFR